ncbi:hypothetical protein BX600DRAFT_505102 [Xylariales sp. PMI_506]|nr:hypothetical protein BX600DRAFT_505102 [Xylariales sp. PMI_506]
MDQPLDIQRDTAAGYLEQQGARSMNRSSQLGIVSRDVATATFKPQDRPGCIGAFSITAEHVVQKNIPSSTGNGIVTSSPGAPSPTTSAFNTSGSISSAEATPDARTVYSGAESGPGSTPEEGVSTKTSTDPSKQRAGRRKRKNPCGPSHRGEYKRQKSSSLQVMYVCMMDDGDKACEKTFTLEKDLIRHQHQSLTHKDACEMLYTCDERGCSSFGRVYTRKDNFRRHVESKHGQLKSTMAQ